METEIATGEELFVAMEDVDVNLAALIDAVRSIDSAPELHPNRGWDGPKWKVFTAAMQFVREKHGTPFTERQAQAQARIAKQS